MSITEALRLAGEQDVDLVEIVAQADPPVCRLMDYGKFKYQEQKKAAEAKSKQKVVEVKEVKFRPGTDEGDYNIKMRNLRRFFEVNRFYVTLAALTALAEDGVIERKVLAEAIKKYGIDPNKPNPTTV